MVSALSPGGALEDFQGKNRDAASFNWFAAAAVRCLHSNRLSPEFDAAADAASFCWHLHSAHGTVWPVSWNQDADPDLDERDRAHQTGRGSGDHIIRRFWIHDPAVRWIHAPAGLGIGLLSVYELLCGCNFAFVHMRIPVVEEKRHCPLFGSVIRESLSDLGHYEKITATQEELIYGTE